MAKVNLQKLHSLVDTKYLTKRKHTNSNLWIFNYTAKCQYDKNWTEETLMCRGLIVDSEGTIIARPFKKFFNLGEHTDDLPTGDFEVHEKMDGSLGILYWIDDKPFIATRGSFESEQAKKGNEILQKYIGRWKHFDKTKTYLFEILFPQNRIVVDYGMTEDLILLAIVDIKTGEEKELNSFPWQSAERFGGWDLNKVKSIQIENKEGFVLKWKNGFRLKVKFDEYVRLHRLVTQVTARSIWDLLRNEQSFDELIERVPDEFFAWVRKKESELHEKYIEIFQNTAHCYEQVALMKTRKEQALYIQKNALNQTATFAMLDKLDYKQFIWKKLRPKHERPFKEEI